MGRYIVLEIKVLEVVYLRLTGISSPHHNAAAFLVSICFSACSPPHMSMLGHSSRLFPMLQAGLFWMWKHSELAGMPSALGKLLGSAHTGHGNAESPLSDTRNSPGDPAAGRKGFTEQEMVPRPCTISHVPSGRSNTISLQPELADTEPFAVKWCIF